MSLDGNLFNSREQTSYSVPASLPTAERIAFNSGSNTLYGYWVPVDTADTAKTVLYCHGNKFSMDEYWDRVEFLNRAGLNVFIFDYRGYGMSEGSSSEEGLHADGETALGFVRDSLNVPDSSLILYGYSLGNVVSIYLASRPGVDPLCLFAECPFASSGALTQGSAGFDIPAGWLLEGEFNNAENIKDIRCPFYLFHGEKDDFVRYRDNGRVVYANAPEPKDRTILPEANHTDIPQTMGVDAYLRVVRAWISAAASGNL